MSLLNMDNLPSEATKKNVDVKFTNVDQMKKDISDRLNSIGESSLDGQDFIFNNYTVFLDELYLRDAVQRGEMITVFTNPRFITDFISVAEQLILDSCQLICCNKLCWDAISLDIPNEVKELLLQLAYIINRQSIQVLSSKVPLYWAKMIALASKSSFNQAKEVKRVNTIIIMSGIKDEQTIVDIYSVLFSDSLSNLFINTVLDKRDISILNEDQIKTYKLLSISVCDILDNMPSDIINTVLIRYSEVLSLSAGDKKTVIIMNSAEFKERYNRISTVMNFNSDIIVP